MESDSPQQDRLLYIGLCVRSVNGSEGPAAAARYGMPCCPAARQPERIFQVPCVFFFSAWTACRPHHSCCVGERRSATGGQRGGGGGSFCPFSPPEGGEGKPEQSALQVWGRILPPPSGILEVFFGFVCPSWKGDHTSFKKKRNFQSLLRMLGEILS